MAEHSKKRISLIWLVFLIAIAAQTTFAAPSTTNVSFYWTFDDADYTAPTLFDLTPNQTNLTNYGSITTGTTGKINQAFNFTGGYAKADKRTILNTDDSFTFNFWIRDTNGLTANAPVFGATTTSGSTLTNWVYLTEYSASYCSGTRPAFVLEPTTGGGVVFCQNRSFSSEWSMHTIIYNGVTNTCQWWTNGTNQTLTFVLGSCTFPAGEPIIGTGGNDSRITLANIDGTYPNYCDGCEIDEYMLIMQELSPTDIAFLYAGGSPTENQQYPFTGGNFTITLKDDYLNTTLNDFTAVVNGTFYHTTTGTITTTISSSSAELVNITVNATKYFNRTYTDYNVSTALAARLHQVELQIEVRSIVSNETINVYTATTNFSSQTATAGLTYFNLSNGTHPFNITATGYEFYQTSFSFTNPPEYSNQTVYLNPNVTFNLYNETGDYFLPNTTTETILRIFCTNQTQEHTFTNHTESFPIQCAWNYMRVYVTMNNETYYRTLIPDYNSTNINWYLVNLNTDTLVQKTFTLNDLNGQFNQGTLFFDKIINASQVRIHQEQWDVEQKVIVYFILYDTYILGITDNEENSRVLGPFLADTTATHTITLPELPFAPENEYGDFKWQYIWIPGEYLYVSFVSESGTLGTVNYVIRNGANFADILLNTTFNTTTGSANYTNITNGSVYITELTFTHSGWSTHVDKKVWSMLFIPDTDFPGFTSEFKRGFSMILVIITGLIFTGLSLGVGMATTTMLLWFFMQMDWLYLYNPTIDAIFLSIFALLTFLIIMQEANVR